MTCTVIIIRKLINAISILNINFNTNINKSIEMYTQFPSRIQTTLLILPSFIVSGEIRVTTNHLSHVYVHCYGHLVTWVNFYNVVQHHFAHTRNISHVGIIIETDRFSPTMKAGLRKNRKKISTRIVCKSGSSSIVQRHNYACPIRISSRRAYFPAHCCVFRASMSSFIIALFPPTFSMFVAKVSGTAQPLMKYS